MILLDWHLDGKSGEIESLKILHNIISKPNIHFCVIYTSEENLANVFKRILTNYSGLIEETFTEYKEYTESIFGEGFDFREFHNISLGRNNPEAKKEIGQLYKKYNTFIKDFMAQVPSKDVTCAIYKISTVNLDFFHHELQHPLPCPGFINQKNYLLEIDNTIITIFKKNENNPENLLDNFFEHIIYLINSTGKS